MVLRFSNLRDVIISKFVQNSHDVLSQLNMEIAVLQC
jgi:hypothetical protein